MDQSETLAAAVAPPTGKRVEPPLVSGKAPFFGHLLQLRRDPIGLMRRVHEECGEVGELRLASDRIVMMYGAEAQEAFFRAPDEQLDQAAAYPFMKPVFGPGVVFDATPEQRKQAMRNSSLRDAQMRGHAEVIAEEVERAIASWGDSGEIDLLDFFAELTIYTSSACLIGREFRQELSAEYVPLFYDLERGTDAFAYVNPYLPLPSFRKRDRARLKIVSMLEAIFEKRDREGQQCEDLFAVLRTIKNKDGSERYTSEQITGMFISMMFAGHHTTSATSSWAMLELLLNPEWMTRVRSELDDLYSDGRDVSYQALREIPVLECVMKESLRLHPPLIVLMRKVMSDFQYKHWTIPAGVTVAASPAVSNRLGEYFPASESFDPTRFMDGRAEDKQVFTYLPFGAGRHRCVGAAFAMMQLKAIFSILIRRFDFEMAQPVNSYRNDNSKMVIALQQPCRVRYRRRRDVARQQAPAVLNSEQAAAGDTVSGGGCRVTLDRDLCQGHAVCLNEAPGVFELDREELKARVVVDSIAPEQRETVENAVRHCPTRALRIVDESKN